MGETMTDLRAAAQQALEYMKSVGKMDMYPEDWAIVERLEAALAEHDKNLAGFKERKANWDIRAPRSPRDLQCKLAEETQERDRQRREYEEQQLAALAEPAQEPVAWKDKTYESLYHQDFGNSIPLYTASPQRKPLTEEEIWRTYKNLWMFHPAEEPRLAGDVLKFARAIERAHGIT